MPNATVTVRELKNKDVGLDISIPSHKEVAGILSSTIEYQVVIVTNLSCFKLPKHKESDNVQFMISKTMAQFEELHKKMNAAFPGTVFPPFPPKALFMNDKLAIERRNTFDHLLKFIAKVPKLVHHHLFLEFLGADSIRAKLQGQRKSSTQTTEESTQDDDEQQTSNPSQASEGGLFDEDVGEEEEDLFTTTTTATSTSDVMLPPQHTRPAHTHTGEPRLFEDQDYRGAMLKEESGEAVIEDSPTPPTPTHTTLSVEDQDLLNIDDDFAALLKNPTTKSVERDKPPVSAKPKPPAKPNIAKKPEAKPKTELPKPPSKPSVAKKPEAKPKTELPKPPAKPSAAKKPEAKPKTELPPLINDDDDIMKYIQDNTTTDDADLFS